MSGENRQYRELMAAAQARLRQLDLREAARRAGLDFDEARGEIQIPCFCETLTLDAATLALRPAGDMWRDLSLLQYLATADGSLPTGRWISLGDIPGGGASRAGSFDGEIDALIAARLGARPIEALRAAVARLGGALEEDARADLAAVFHFAPRYPLRLNLWLADDEFPASGKLLVDAGVKRCLGLEAAGSVAVLLARALCE